MSSNDSNSNDVNSNLMFLLGQLANINGNPQNSNNVNNLSSNTEQRLETFQTPTTSFESNGNPVEKNGNSGNDDEDDDDYDPVSDYKIKALSKQSQPPNQSVIQSKPSRSIDSTHSVIPIDPRKITTYSAALKYIVQVLIPSNPNFIDTVRVLIEEQQRDEVRWYNERQAIIRRQASRSDGRQHLNRILGRLSKTASTTLAEPSEPSNDMDETLRENSMELRRYDTQVYRNCVEKMKRAKNVLRSLKVPLICVERAYAIEQKVDLKQLDKDTQKVIEFLQDLCENEDAQYLDGSQ